MALSYIRFNVCWYGNQGFVADMILTLITADSHCLADGLSSLCSSLTKSTRAKKLPSQLAYATLRHIIRRVNNQATYMNSCKESGVGLLIQVGSAEGEGDDQVLAQDVPASAFH